jgi:hypothetical protein
MCRCFRGLVIFTAMTLLVASPSRAASGLAGSTSLGLVEAPASLLGLDLKALEWEVCGNPNGDPTIRGTVIVIANDGGGNSGDRSRLAVEILDEEPGPLEGMVLASVRPVLFELIGGAPITLSCGSFTYKVLLDDEVVQPVSILTLVGGDRTGAYGTCAGNLSIEARLYLTRIERPSETLSFPRSLTLQVSGHKPARPHGGSSRRQDRALALLPGRRRRPRDHPVLCGRGTGREAVEASPFSSAGIFLRADPKRAPVYA